MNNFRPTWAPSSLWLVGLILAGDLAVADDQHPRNYSAFAEAAPPTAQAPSLRAVADLVDKTHPAQFDRTLNLPTFLWTARQQPPQAMQPRALAADPRALAGFAAKNYLNRYAALYRLGGRGLAAAEVRHVHDLGRGAVVAKLIQKVDGIEVFQREMNVLMDQELGLLALSGYLSPHVPETQARTATSPFPLDYADAIAAAFLDLHRETLPPSGLRPTREQGDYHWYEADPGALAGLAHAPAEPIRAKRVYYQLADRLQAAYYLELHTQATDGAQGGSFHYAYVLSAEDGKLLFRKNLTAQDSATPPAAFTYRVWADADGEHLPYDSPKGNGASPFPAGQPYTFQPGNDTPRNRIALAHGPISTQDPWLPPNATQTLGNNVDAYADLAAPDGFGPGDLRASTARGRLFNPTQQPEMGIVQAFYTTNFLHDWLYGHGFDETAGNAQHDNFGRGGFGGDGDRMRVEVQDHGGKNNANMSTPADGGKPVMQMYLWDGKGGQRLTINQPDGLARAYKKGNADFGPSTFNVTGDVALVDDGIDATTDGCDAPFANAAALAGKIALIDRGTCTFATKVKNAQDAGATAVLVVNNVSGAPPGMGGSDSTIVIPSFSVSLGDGAKLKGALAQGTTVSATLWGYNKLINGELDNTIVAHEWAHFLSDRLVGNASGLDNNQGRSLGEGWSDFLALLMTVKPADPALPGNAGFGGAYPVASHAMAGLLSQPYYFGIRRYPYSTDFAKHPLTFKYIEDGVPLPTDAPLSPLADPSGAFNSEVHRSGEIWALALWEAYAALLNDTARLDFAEAQNRMLDYLVASLELTPVSPTFVEARDALLAVAKASDPNDYRLFWRAFAKRGLGAKAVAPDWYSYDHAGVVEDFSLPADVTP